MATQTQEAPAATAPELTILTRVGSVPLVADSLDTINTTLLNNAYTRSPYSLATELSKKALSYTVPLQRLFAPITTRADGLANIGFDAVEARIPYVLHTPTKDIINDIKGRSDQAKDVATKTIDEKVRTPAANIVQGIDQSFAPLVDYFAGAVKQMQPNGTADKPCEPRDTKYQYQRAYYLSKDLSDQLVTYSSEQINQIKAQSVILQRASATAQSLTDLASSSYGAAQSRVHALSDTMLNELHKVQASTAALPGTLQSTFHDVSINLTSTINELSGILTSPDPFNEKASKVRDTVQERVQPVLDTAIARVQEILTAVKPRVSEDKQAQDSTINNGAPIVNGNGNGHA